ncbi:MAG: hypothetical protein ACYS9T_06165 [Planctomycetota bacterium]
MNVKYSYDNWTDIRGHLSPSRPYYGSLNEWNRRFFGDIDKNGKLLLRGGDLRLYGRRGQRQMLDILEGRVDDAVKYCEEPLAKVTYRIDDVVTENLERAQ